MNAEQHSAACGNTAPATINWAGFDTEAHREAQDACRHLIHCAVDATTRKAVVKALESARHTGDLAAFPLLVAQLTGPCCLPPSP